MTFWAELDANIQLMSSVRGFNNTSSLFPYSLQLPPLISLLPAWYIDRPTSTAAARPVSTYVGALARARAFLCVRVLRFVVSRYAHFHIRMHKPISLFLSHSASCIPLGESIQSLLTRESVSRSTLIRR